MNRAALIAVLVLAVAGCTLGPRYHPPAPPAPTAPSYQESPMHYPDSDWKVASPQDAMLRGPWWQVFQDAELNGLEEKLAINNQNIKQYFENFMAARAMVAEARAGYFPVVTINPSFSKGGGGASTVSGPGTGASTTATATTSSSGGRSAYTLPLDISWEPDLWGKIRDEVNAASYGAQVSAADLENERLTEQAALAEYFFELRGQDSLQFILNQIVTADTQALALAEGAYRAGTDTMNAVYQARTALETAQAQATGAAAERAQYEHAIAVLVGATATGFTLPVRAAEFTPPAIPTGVPSQLVERRPDVAAAERTLAQANAEIDIGYSAFFPQVTLDADAGLESTALRELLSLPSRFWALGGSASQTVFNGGLYRAQLQQYQATYDADLAAYRQSVLTAFQQVEDYLAAVRVESNEIRLETAAANDAQSFFSLETERYRTGVDPYVDVLTAQTTLLSAKMTLAELQIQRMTAAVELVQALGGGWDVSQLPSAAEVGKKPAPGNGGGH